MHILLSGLSFECFFRSVENAGYDKTCLYTETSRLKEQICEIRILPILVDLSTSLDGIFLLSSVRAESKLSLLC